MRQQSRSYTCGLAAIANALECLHIKKTQQQIAKLCDCNPADGTSEEEMKRALLACGAQVDEFNGESLQAMSWLHEHLLQRGPAILCVDAHEHWVTVVGVLNFGHTFVVFDSAKGAGVRVYRWQGLKTRWGLGAKQGGPAYYGLGVSL
jgi:ABC-type bacteriocin/lantibiotic exporter with double-glycine peptidase domain